MSAHNLYLEGLTLEYIFQSSKIFQDKNNKESIITFEDILKDVLDIEERRQIKESPSKTTKMMREFMRENKNNIELICFEYGGKKYPTRPLTLFYDYIYILALMDNKHISEKLKDYDIFTDIEFNHKKSLNT